MHFLWKVPVPANSFAQNIYVIFFILKEFVMKELTQHETGQVSGGLDILPFPWPRLPLPCPPGNYPWPRIPLPDPIPLPEPMPKPELM